MHRRWLVFALIAGIPVSAAADVLHRGGFVATNPNIIVACLAVKHAAHQDMCKNTATREKKVTPCNCHKRDDIWSCEAAYETQCKDEHVLFDSAWMSTGTALGWSYHSESLACRSALQNAQVVACPSNFLSRKVDGCACIRDGNLYACLVDYSLYCHSPYGSTSRRPLAASLWIRPSE